MYISLTTLLVFCVVVETTTISTSEEFGTPHKINKSKIVKRGECLGRIVLRRLRGRNDTETFPLKRLFSGIKSASFKKEEGVFRKNFDEKQNVTSGVENKPNSQQNDEEGVNLNLKKLPHHVKFGQDSDLSENLDDDSFFRISENESKEESKKSKVIEPNIYFPVEDLKLDKYDGNKNEENEKIQLFKNNLTLNQVLTEKLNFDETSVESFNTLDTRSLTKKTSSGPQNTTSQNSIKKYSSHEIIFVTQNPNLKINITVEENFDQAAKSSPINHLKNKNSIEFIEENDDNSIGENFWDEQSAPANKTSENVDNSIGENFWDEESPPANKTSEDVINFEQKLPEINSTNRDKWISESPSEIEAHLSFVRKLLAEVFDGNDDAELNTIKIPDELPIPEDDFIFDGRRGNVNSSTTPNRSNSLQVKPTNDQPVDIFTPISTDLSKNTSLQIDLLMIDLEAEANQITVAPYNMRKEVCCSGKVYPLPHTYSYTSCCGNSQYSVNKQVCCGNKAYDMKESHVCCGNMYHSPRNSMCCYHPYTGEANLVPIASSLLQYALCCGIRVYDTRTHICCTMEVSETGAVRPGSDQFLERVTRFIIYDRIYKNSGCCRGKVYDIDSTRGCLNTEEGSRSLWTRLKPDLLHPIGICGHEPYDTKNFWCCSGRGYADISGPIRYRISSKPCCGFHSYDEEKHVCCGGVRFMQNIHGSLVCCGNNSIYDTRIQECCDNSFNVIPTRVIMGSGDMCCGVRNIPYYSHSQVCCGNTVFEIPDTRPGEYKCCINPLNTSEVAVYLKGKEICCTGRKYTLSTAHTHCCGQLSYSPITHLCCEGNLYKKLSEFDSCCASKTYNAHGELCCGRDEWAAMKRSKAKRKCCINEFGFPNSFNECKCDVPQPVTYPRLTRGSSCCGMELYNARSHRCCNMTIIDPNSHLCCRVHEWDREEVLEYVVEKRTPNAVCCGNQSYNPISQLCCNNSVVAWIGLQDMACCDKTAYNRKTQVCCKGSIFDVDFQNVSCCGNRAYTPAIEICCNKTEEIFPVTESKRVTLCCYSD